MITNHPNMQGGRPALWPDMKRTLAFFAAVLLTTSASLRAQEARAPAAPNPMRPATVTWGGYSHNEQMIGADDQWEFVQKYMDGFVMHGMYWINKRDYAGVVPDDQWTGTLKALGRALQRYNKPAHIETGLGENEWEYDHADPHRRQACGGAQKDIAKLKEFLQYGVKVTKVRVDWFPIAAAAVYAAKYKTSSAKDILAMVTGAEKYWGTVPGFDPAKANWREYARLMNEAIPGIELGFDQAPCNFYAIPPDPAIRSLAPWEGFGYGYLSKGLTTMYNHKTVLVDGKPVALSLDFADRLMSVALSSRDLGVNFYAFEGDTPYVYVTNNHGRMGDKLMPFLLHIERILHRYGFHNAKIVNDCPWTPDVSGFTIDLGTEQEVDCVRVHWRGDYAKRFVVQGSKDNKTWATLKSMEDCAGGVSEIRFKKQPIRWVKAETRIRATPRGYQISEVEVFGPAQSGVNLALKKRTQAISNKPKGNPPYDFLRKTAGRAPELVDGDMNTYWESDYISNDAWDKYYHDRTLEYIETYQAAGGRADQYVAESWYPGPYTLFPESKDGSFSDLAKDLIRRIRGIDIVGTPFKADLAARRRGDQQFIGEKVYQQEPRGAQAIMCRLAGNEPGSISYEILVRNDGVEQHKGDCRATPLLRARISGTEARRISCTAADGKDITEQILCRGDCDGYFVGGLEPGESKTVILTIGPELTTARDFNLKVILELYWNPQDPQVIVRDALSISVARE